jgi:anaerobic magnesium-protoporphyrin IX monomethyl ester cyclase
MCRAKAMLINPNPRSMSLISPVVSHFYNILKANDIKMKFFDTTFYDLSDKYADPEKKMTENLSIKEIKGHLPGRDATHKKYDELLHDFRREVEDFQPDVILASAMESTVTLTREILGYIRDLKIPHILGGVFATYAPELAISFPEIDAICIGEGENVIVELILKVKKGESIKNISNIWLKDNKGHITKNKMSAPISLDDLPRFDVTVFDESRFYRAMEGKIYRMFPVETHRGCPLKCAFCNSPIQDDAYKRETGMRYFRAKSMKKVLEDIRYFAEDCKAEYLFFWSDNFFEYNKQEIDEFCEAYKDYKIPFFVQTYPTSIDAYKIKKLVDVGLHLITMGIEHGNEKFRREVINRQYSNAKVLERIKILKNFNVTYSCNNIVGFPHETPKLHWDTVMLTRELGAETSSCAIFTPFHGTPLRKMAIEEGFLKDPNTLAPSNFDYSILDMPQFPADLIKAKARVFNLYVKFPKSRWKDIEKAEKLTPEGNRIFEELRQEINF